MISSVLLVISMHKNWSILHGMMQGIFLINSAIFFLFLFGLNLVFLLPWTGSFRASIIMTLMPGLGGCASIVIGYLWAISRTPYFAELSQIFIAFLNMIISIKNFDENRQISIFSTPYEKKLFIFFVFFFLIRIFMLQDRYLYLDDQVYASTIQNFMNSDPYITVKVFSPYFGRDLDWYYPWGFHLWIGLFLKGAGVQAIAPAILHAKTFLILSNSFIIFPLYLCLTLFVKNKSIITIFIVILCFNQWVIIETPYLLLDTTYIFFFTASIYFFFTFLQDHENVSGNALLGIFLGSSAAFIRPNGSLQMFIVLFMFILLFLFKWIKEKKIRYLSDLACIRDHDPGRFVALGKWCFLQGIFIVIFFIIPQIDYFYKNGITMFDFATKGTGFAYFNEGNAAQFTPVDSFSLSWLLERLSINVPFYVLNLTQLTGFIHFGAGFTGVKIAVNLAFSLFLFIYGLLANVYFWFRYLRTRFLFVLCHALLLVVNFLPILLWGETYSQLYRTSQNLLVLFFTPMIVFTKDYLSWIEKRIKKKIAKLVISRILFGVMAATVIYSAMIFFGPLLFQKATFDLVDYIKWQFYNMPIP